MYFRFVSISKIENLIKKGVCWRLHVKIRVGTEKTSQKIGWNKVHDSRKPIVTNRNNSIRDMLKYKIRTKYALAHELIQIMSENSINYLSRQST